MSNFTDPDYLRSTQYKDSSNLGARIQLHERFTTTNVDLHRWMVDLMQASFPSDARILEIGCGRGNLWWKNADRSALVISEVQSLVDYYNSWKYQDIDEAAFSKMTLTVLQERGSIHITKEIGALISRGYADEAIR